MAINPDTGLADDTKKISVPEYLKISKLISFVLYLWIMLGVVMLALRTFLLLTSANPSSGFVDFVYRISADYLHPFRAIFPAKEVGETGYLDVSALFAIVVYLIIAWIVSSLLKLVQSKMDDVRSQEAARAERNRIRIIKQKELARQNSEIIEETTTVNKRPGEIDEVYKTTTRGKKKS